MQLEQAPAKVLRDSVSAYGSIFRGPSLGPRWRCLSGGSGYGAAGPCWGIGGLRPRSWALLSVSLLLCVPFVLVALLLITYVCNRAGMLNNVLDLKDEHA